MVPAQRRVVSLFQVAAAPPSLSPDRSRLADVPLGLVTAGRDHHSHLRSSHSRQHIGAHDSDHNRPRPAQGDSISTSQARSPGTKPTHQSNTRNVIQAPIYRAGDQSREQQRQRGRSRDDRGTQIALPLCCNTNSQGNAISEIPLPAAADRAVNRRRGQLGRGGAGGRYDLGSNLARACPAASDFRGSCRVER